MADEIEKRINLHKELVYWRRQRNEAMEARTRAEENIALVVEQLAELENRGA